MKLERAHAVKILVLAFYILAIVSVYLFIHWNGIHFRDLPRLISARVSATGSFGPLVMVGLFVAQTVIPFSGVGLTVVSGSLFGPLVGVIVSVIGLNIASSISFFIGRFLGRHLVSEHERSWVKKYDDLLTEQGFISIFAMRVMHFPFDFVSLGAGMTRMTFRQFAAGTFLGSLPGVVTLAILGDAFDSPRSWLMFFLLLVISVGLVGFTRRSEWVKKRLFKQIDPEQLG